MELVPKKITGLGTFWTASLHGKKARDLVPQSLIASSLYKQSGFLAKGWERRFVLLLPMQVLCYFADEDDSDPRGVLLLSPESTVEQAPSELLGKNNAFSIRPNPTEDAARVLHLAADSPDEARAWCEAMFANRTDVLRAERTAAAGARDAATTRVTALEAELAEARAALTRAAADASAERQKVCEERDALAATCSALRIRIDEASGAATAANESFTAVAALLKEALDSAASAVAPLVPAYRHADKIKACFAAAAAELAVAAVGSSARSGSAPADAVAATPAADPIAAAASLAATCAALRANASRVTAAGAPMGKGVGRFSALSLEAASRADAAAAATAKATADAEQAAGEWAAKEAGLQAGWKEKEAKIAGLFTQVNDRLKAEREKGITLAAELASLRTQLDAATAAAGEAKKLAAAAMHEKTAAVAAAQREAAAAKHQAEVATAAAAAAAAAASLKASTSSEATDGHEASRLALAPADPVPPPEEKEVSGSAVAPAPVAADPVAEEIVSASVASLDVPNPAAPSLTVEEGSSATSPSPSHSHSRSRSGSLSESMASLLGLPLTSVAPGAGPGSSTDAAVGFGSASLASPAWSLGSAAATQLAATPGAASASAASPFNALADPHPGRLYVLVMGARHLPQAAFSSLSFGVGTRHAYARLRALDQPDKVTRHAEVADKGAGRGLCATFHQCQVLRVTRELAGGSFPLRVELAEPRTMRADGKLGSAVLDVSAVAKWPRQPHAVWVMLHSEDSTRAAKPDPAEVPVPVQPNTVLSTRAAAAAAAGAAGAYGSHGHSTAAAAAGSLELASSALSAMRPGSLDAAAGAGVAAGGSEDKELRWAMPELPPPPVEQRPCVLVQLVYAPAGEEPSLAFHMPAVAGAGSSIGSAAVAAAPPAAGAHHHLVATPAVAAASVGTANAAGSAPSASSAASTSGGAGVASGATSRDASVGHAGSGGMPPPSPAAPVTAAATAAAAESELVSSLKATAADQKSKLEKLARAYKELQREKTELQARVADLTAEVHALRARLEG